MGDAWPQLQRAAATAQWGRSSATNLYDAGGEEAHTPGARRWAGPLGGLMVELMLQNIQELEGVSEITNVLFLDRKMGWEGETERGAICA